MASEQLGQEIGWLVAAADLSAKQYYFVDIDSNGKIALASAAGQATLGILQNKPKAGEAASVRYLGVSKCIAGTGGLTAGQAVQAAADGTAIAASTGDYTGWMAVETAAAGVTGTIVSLVGGQNN